MLRGVGRVDKRRVAVQGVFGVLRAHHARDRGHDAARIAAEHIPDTQRRAYGDAHRHDDAHRLAHRVVSHTPEFGVGFDDGLLKQMDRYDNLLMGERHIVVIDAVRIGTVPTVV